MFLIAIIFEIIELMIGLMFIIFDVFVGAIVFFCGFMVTLYLTILRFWFIVIPFIILLIILESIFKFIF